MTTPLRPSNRRRGEVRAMLGGRERRLVLTLGALAELEDAFGAEGSGELVERLVSGRLRAADMETVILAGLRGGGDDIDRAELSAMDCEGGAAGFAAITVALLTATFGTMQDGTARSEGVGEPNG